MGLFGVDWQTVDRKIARAFPAVEFVCTESLLFEVQLRVAPTIVDVRLTEEYDVSHIPRAHNLQSAEAIAAAFPDYAEPIVVYCSVGYRSAAVAEELASVGYTSVKNLRHSIFEWAERGYGLENAAGSTAKVHPYNRAWGALFPKSYMLIRLKGSAAGKLFPPGLRLILHKPVSSDA